MRAPNLNSMDSPGVGVYARVKLHGYVKKIVKLHGYVKKIVTVKTTICFQFQTATHCFPMYKTIRHLQLETPAISVASSVVAL